MVHQQIQQRPHVGPGLGRVIGGVAFLGGGEDVRDVVELFFAAQLGQQLQRFVQRLGGPSVGAVDFIDDDHRFGAGGECLFEHEPRLRHRTFGGVDQHQTPVGHLHDPFDFAAEIRVSRGVDQVDFHVAVRQRDVLGQDRDAAFAFQVVRVQDPFALQFGVAELAGLTQQDVDQRRFAVVDVGDDDDVAEVGTTQRIERFRGKTAKRRPRPGSPTSQSRV